jgi:hypothetical protein
VISHEKLRRLICKAFKNANRRASTGSGAFSIRITSIVPPKEVQTLPSVDITDDAPEPS